MNAALSEAKDAYADGRFDRVVAATAVANAENLERLTYMTETLTNALLDLAVVARRALQTRSPE